MTVSIEPYTEDTWERVRPLVGTSFFGSPGFSGLWRSMEGAPVCVVIEQGGQPAAALPGVEFGIWPLKRFYAMPDGCYTRLYLHPDVADQRELMVQRVLEAIASRRHVKAFLFDFHDTLGRHPLWDVQNRVTTLVDVSKPDWQPPDSRLRAQIRRAEREGLRVQKFNWNQHHDRFLDLVRQTDQRHGQRAHLGAAFFRALADLAARDDRVRWAWCEHDGQAVASHIYFIEDNMLQSWQPYFDKAFSLLRANQYLCFTVCRQMARRGVQFLNLGVSPSDAIGLQHYKSRWGGRTYEYRCYVRRRGLGRIW